MRNNYGDEAHTLHGKIAEKNTRLVVSNEAGVFEEVNPTYPPVLLVQLDGRVSADSIVILSIQRESAG